MKKIFKDDNKNKKDKINLSVLDKINLVDSNPPVEIIVNNKLNLSNILRSVKFNKNKDIRKIIVYAYTVLLKIFLKFLEKKRVSFFIVINFKG